MSLPEQTNEIARAAEHDHGGHDHGGHEGAAHQHRGHGHAGHNHVHGSNDQRRIAWAFVLIAAFMVVEVVGGMLSGSLALLADAGHMVSDAAALGFSWLAIQYGRRPANALLSYGYRRLEILAAFVNGLALFVIAAWIVIEAIERFNAPVPVAGKPMLIVAFAGLLANLVAFAVLNGGNQDNLNMRGAWLHVLGDLLGSVAAIVAALVILLTGWTPIDPLLSILVALIVLRSAWQVVRSSSHVLLEGTPGDIDTSALKMDLETELTLVSQVHHIHVWSLTGDEHMITLHVQPAAAADADADVDAIVQAVRARLRTRFGIRHATVQVERTPCDDALHARGGPAA